MKTYTVLENVYTTNMDTSSENEIKPFVRQAKYPHELKIYFTVLFVLLIGAQMRVISVWWMFMWSILPIVPSELKKIHTHGLWPYLDELHFKRPSLKDIGVIFLGLFVIFSILTVLGLGLIYYYTSMSSGGIESIENGGHLLSDAVLTWWIYLLAIIGMYTIVGPVEELLFRHKLQNVFKKNYSIAQSIVATNAIFAVFHIPVLIITGDLLMILYPLVGIFLLGSIFSIQYEYTSNLLIPSLTHSTYNSILLTILFLVPAGV